MKCTYCGKVVKKRLIEGLFCSWACLWNKEGDMAEEEKKLTNAEIEELGLPCPCAF